MAYYAWTNFPVERDEWGKTTKVVKAGDSVSQSDLDVSDEEWQEYIDIGAVREDEYPDVPTHTSPAEAERARLTAEAEAADAREVLLKLEEGGEEAGQAVKEAPKAAAPTPTSQSGGTSSSSSSS